MANHLYRHSSDAGSMEVMMGDNHVFTERARKAAEARWGKERIFKRIETIGAGLRAADPELTPEQAIARAIRENPELYARFVAAASKMPSMTHAEMIAAHEEEVRALCAIAGKPELASFFVDQRTHARDVLQYLLDTKRAPPPKT